MRRPPVLASLTTLILLLGQAGLAGSAAPAPAVGWRDGGSWRWPIQPVPPVSRGFDPPAAPWLPGHRGVDLAGRPGGAVHAAGPGVVSFAGRVAGTGVVSIRHAGGLVTTYQPVQASVDAGERVTAGAVIGRLVEAGSHCLSGACLHWGLRRGADYLDPLLLVVGFTVRLVPLDGPPLPAAP